MALRFCDICGALAERHRDGSCGHPMPPSPAHDTGRLLIEGEPWLAWALPTIVIVVGIVVMCFGLL